MKKAFSILFILIAGLSLSAQKTTGLPEDDEKMLKALTALFEEQQKDAGKTLIEQQLKPMWLTPGQFSDAEKKNFRQTIDLLTSKRYSVIPTVQQYIELSMLFKEMQTPAAKVNGFHDLLNQCIKNNSKKINKATDVLIASALGLFRENTIYSDVKRAWKTDNSNFDFAYDSLPKIVFPSLKISCVQGDKNIFIENTQGFYSLSEKTFYGQGGRVPWNIVGYDPTKTFATLSFYEIKVTESQYDSENVTFQSEFFNLPLVGILTNKIQEGNEKDKQNYPEFQSNQSRLTIKNIIPNVDYEGGFTLAGSSLKGTGPQQNPARLIIYKDGKNFLESKSQLFDIRPDRIESLHASVRFYVDSDSVYHPDLRLVLNRKSRNLSLSRNEDGVSPSPFVNTYHNVEMYVETIEWNLDAPLMNFGAFGQTAQKFADFESINYFEKNRYQTLQGISTIHPCTLLNETYKKTGTETFSALDFAQTARTGIEQWIPLFFDLNNKGYIYYEPETRMITVQPKLLNHIQSNKLEKDYDILQFSSSVEKGSNAQLSLLSMELKIDGIRNIYLSDSQKVVVYPDKGQVILKKNRDYSFDGAVYAGNLQLVGAKFDFNYELFELTMNQVDSCVIYINDENGVADIHGNMPKKRVKTVLRNLTGTVQIDHPSNKSGYISKDYTTYPKMSCTRKSDVFWDKKTIQNGAYTKDEFGYTLNPFDLDSLDNFTKSNLVFEGSLESNGMLPVLNEPLVLMEDNSLGFHLPLKEEGIKAYNNKVHLTGDLTLNHSGMKSKGDLNYLTTHAKSEDFTLTPRLLFGLTTEYKNDFSEKANVADYSAAKVELKYAEKDEALIVATKTEHIIGFKNEAEIIGSTTLTPKGMIGQGEIMLVGASVSSKKFNLKSRIILADTSSFNIKNADNSNALALKTDNVSANIDFDKRKGNFKSNNGETKIEFPANEYICFMDQFTWFMDKSEMELSSNRKANTDLVIDTDQEKRKSNFYSIKEGQDSLNFLSPYAKYDLKASQITCNKVDYIIVADSKVQPDSNYVVIEKNANMRELNRAQVISNFVTQYHKIFNAKVKINGRKDYQGSGDIAYKDENKLEQIIHVTYFGLDSTYQTMAMGEIAENQEFWLSPAFEFKGKFEVYASNPNYLFNGGVRVLHNCESMDRTFMAFKSIIDPNEIFIPVTASIKDVNDSPLGLGVIVRDESPMNIYPGFMSNKSNAKDQGLIESNGFLYYDKARKTYFVGSKEKIRQPKLNGQLIGLNTTTCELTGDGKMDFNVDFGLMTMKSVGNVKFNTKDSTLSAKSVTLLNFPFNDDIQKHIADKMIQSDNLTPIDISKTLFEKSLVEFLGVEKSDKIITDMALDGAIKKFPEELQTTIFFTDLNWQWNAENETFIAMGNIGIGGMGKKQIFKYVKGLIEIQKRKTGDVLTVYLELSGADYYMFEYKSTIMSLITQDNAIVEIFAKLKDTDRTFEENKKRFTFNYLGATTAKTKKDKFLQKYPEFENN
ncbi:MAG: hypothetical protein ACK5EW_09790 [Bacteroidota bacterium]|jgi:hypothetical protein